MKVAPVYHALKGETWCAPSLIHTGQHYDPEMSAIFLADLQLPQPDHQLGVSSSHAEQAAGVMVAYERICLESRPDWIVVVGDVNSTMAAALVAAKLCIPLAHLEAGLRSGEGNKSPGNPTWPRELRGLVRSCRPMGLFETDVAVLVPMGHTKSMIEALCGIALTRQPSPYDEILEAIWRRRSTY